uniref:F-box domain-containing protein n=1 Tax=Steinernema glaseri TaxID=37863 RepID=A0A1I7YT06_9BILA
MDSVPSAFLENLCARLQKKSLEELQKILNLWSRTVETHYSRRRELTVHLNPNKDETKVGIGINKYGDWYTEVPYTSLSKYDRIRCIFLGFTTCANLPNTITMERFKTKVLPVLTSMTDVFVLEAVYRSPKNLMESLFSFLRAPALNIYTGYTGQKCVEFIEQQIALGRLKKLNLKDGNEWPESMKTSLLAFLKSSNFKSLDLRETNLTVDLDMLIIMVERFYRRDFRHNAIILGNSAHGETKDFQEAVRSDGTIPLVYGLPEPSEISRNEEMFWIYWTLPGSENARLRLKYVSRPDSVTIRRECL